MRFTLVHCFICPKWRLVPSFVRSTILTFLHSIICPFIYMSVNSFVTVLVASVMIKPLYLSLSRMFNLILFSTVAYSLYTHICYTINMLSTYNKVSSLLFVCNTHFVCLTEEVYVRFCFRFICYVNCVSCVCFPSHFVLMFPCFHLLTILSRGCVPRL